MNIIDFKYKDTFISIYILCITFFLLYVIREILDENNLLKTNKLERFFKRSEPLPSDYVPNESKGETHARKLAFNLFGKPFEKIRPDMLRNNVTGHNLELDLYNDELKLGIEYSGAQHYNYIPFFHKNYEMFQTQKYRDEIKRMLCVKNGINLIEIPYTVKLRDMETFLLVECRKLGFDV